MYRISSLVSFQREVEELYGENYYEYGAGNQGKTDSFHMRNGWNIWNALNGSLVGRKKIPVQEEENDDEVLGSTMKAVKSLLPVYSSSISLLLRGVLSIVLRLGMLLVQLGSIPMNNVNLILLQNLLDVTVVSVVYLLLGFALAFNGDTAGLIGGDFWIWSSEANEEEAFLGWEAAMAASGICTSGIVGRMHTVGYVLSASLLAGLLQPVLLHWIWSPRGWMATGSLAGKRVHFHDDAGASVIHILGALSGTIGSLVLGRRLLRLRDIDEASIPRDSGSILFCGHFLIFVGLQGLSLARTSRMLLTTRLVFVNGLLAGSGCALMVVALHFTLSREPFNHWTVARCLQAVTAGIVTLSAGIDFYSPLAALSIGASGGLVFYVLSRRVFRSALEDYCNIFAGHLGCALLGSFMAPLAITTSTQTPINSRLADLGWQLICLVALLSLVLCSMAPLFLSLELFGFLRNRSEYLNNLRSRIALRRGPARSYMQRLFFPDGEAIYLQPSLPTMPNEVAFPIIPISSSRDADGTRIDVTDADDDGASPRFLQYHREISKFHGTASRGPSF
ncbi:ammonium transporter 1 member 1-like [Cephus cinctus]|uniref:Ammonium transporter 1 member 1-like n=1 Tax=Cephus cinctus TaxID=211228 RepID=A0AAJ7CAI9_CEPCN|nr:ammonium transporter 1 member 1-like [Cephus cinctus]